MSFLEKKKKLGGVVGDVVLQVLNNNGYFMGTSNEFLALPSSEKERLMTIYREIIDKEKVKHDRYIWEKLCQFGLFSREFEVYSNLAQHIKKEFENNLQSSRRDHYKLYNEVLLPYKVFEGSFSEYENLSYNEKEILRLRVSIVNILDICVRKLDDLGKKLLLISDKTEYIAELNKFKKTFSSIKKTFSISLNLLTSLEENGVVVPVDVSSRLKNNFEIPKFDLFDSKYKKWSQLIDSEYVIMLKTRQIFSYFDRDDDFCDKVKWKQFFDTKKMEYDQFVAAGIYSKTFEEYLNENSVVTFELLGKFRFPQEDYVSSQKNSSTVEKIYSSYSANMDTLFSRRARNSYGDLFDFVGDTLRNGGEVSDFSFEPIQPQNKGFDNDEFKSNLKR